MWGVIQVKVYDVIVGLTYSCIDRVYTGGKL